MKIKEEFMWKTLLPALLLICGSVSYETKAQTADPKNECFAKSAKILILGSYHMDNPGQDKYNLEADDVLSPKRQLEIAEIVEKLVRFQPTKIAVESAYRSNYWTSRYEQFLKGEHNLGRNEIEQIGFQLAKRLKLPTLYPIDYPMWLNGTTANEREAPKPKPNASPLPSPQTKANEQKPELPDYLVKQEKLMRTGTVLEVLRYINSDEYSRPSHFFYMNMLLPPDGIYIYEQTDLTTNWYKRNLRMFTNLNRVTDFPNDRVLLLVGAGHLKILRDFARDSPYFCVANTEDYLK